LVSPITWDHYFLLLALPLTIVWRDATTTARRLALLAIVFVAFMNPMLVWTLIIGAASTAGPAHSLLLLGVPTYALVGLYWIQLVELKKLKELKQQDLAPSTPHANCVRPG
jgi:hypothetical protein